MVCVSSHLLRKVRSVCTCFRWVWVSVGYLLGAIVVLHIVIIAAQKFLGPLETSSAVLSEEALRVRNVALYGQAGKGEVDDTVVDVNDEVDTCPISLCKHPCSLHYASPCLMMLHMDVQSSSNVFLPSQQHECGPLCQLSMIGQVFIGKGMHAA